MVAAESCGTKARTRYVLIISLVLFVVELRKQATL